MLSRNIWLIGIGSATLLAASGSALGQEAATGWTGGRIGAGLGVGMGSVDTVDTLTPAEVGLGTEAVIGGVFAGYVYEAAPGLIFGVEAGVQFFNSEASTTSLTVAADYEFRSLGSLYAGILAGAEIAPRTLAYGSFSYAAIHAQTSLVTSDARETFLNGYRAAVGLETEIMESVTLRLEGNYTQSVDTLSINGGATEYTPSHLGAELGILYRFGGAANAPGVLVASEADWSSAYFGLLGSGLASSTKNGFRELEGSPSEGPVSTIDAAFGAFVGFNMQMGEQWVAGLEGDVSAYVADFDYVADDSQDFASSDHKGQVSVRFGYLVNPTTLVYGRAGYGLMHMNPDTTFAAAGTEGKYLQTLSAGMGIETMVMDNALVRVEGLYGVALEEYRFLDSSPGDPFYAKPTSAEARLGAAFLF